MMPTLQFSFLIELQCKRLRQTTFKLADFFPLDESFIFSRRLIMLRLTLR